MQSKSWVEPGSRRSPGGVLLQLKSGAKFGSRRSPNRAYRQLKLATEPGSRRSPGGVLLGVVDGARRVNPAENFDCGYFIPNKAYPKRVWDITF